MKTNLPRTFEVDGSGFLRLSSNPGHWEDRAMTQCRLFVKSKTGRVEHECSLPSKSSLWELDRAVAIDKRSGPNFVESCDDHVWHCLALALKKNRSDLTCSMAILPRKVSQLVPRMVKQIL